MEVVVTIIVLQLVRPHVKAFVMQAAVVIVAQVVLMAAKMVAQELVSNFGYEGVEFLRLR